MDQSILSSRAIMGMYYARLDTADGVRWVNNVSNLFMSDQEVENYAWLGQSPAMREWIGGRQAKGLRANPYSITNKHYEATLEIAVKDARRDKTGQIQARINELADRSQSHWASLLSTLILNGPSTVCYDGSFFFHTAHTEGDSGTQDNDLSIDISGLGCAVHGADATAPSVEEMQQCILRAVTAIMGFKDDRGEPMNENANQFVVLVAPSLYLTAQAAVSTLSLSALAQNLVRSLPPSMQISVEMNARLTSWTANFAVFRADGSVKPLIRQQETGADVGELKAKAEGSEFEFDNDAWQFGIDAWRNVGYGYWQYGCFVTMI